ncbi:hypothetical protein J7E70_33385 [Variovorax paradoxus]|nr:hypothetical protein [Variovorax paradoxus]MBT2305298.1 hypothetical protein [Variovorax paradoxus]
MPNKPVSSSQAAKLRFGTFCSACRTSLFGITITDATVRHAKQQVKKKAGSLPASEGSRCGFNPPRRPLTARIALGGQDPPWWTDGAPDLDHHLVSDSLYAQWFAETRSQRSA